MSNQAKILQIAIFCIALIYLSRLFFIQVIDENTAMSKAKGLAIKTKVVKPQRGNIYDRKGEKLVVNKVLFSLSLVARDLVIEDTTDFCELFNFELQEVRDLIKEANKGIQRYKPFEFKKNLTSEDYAQIQDRLVNYPGVLTEYQFICHYPHKSLANVLGYLKEVSRDDLNRDTANFYRMRDLIGKSGLEKYYERQLRGRRGKLFIYKDNLNVERGSYEDGKFDTLPEAGKDLYCSVDLELQEYGERLMQNKRGAIVAIEPSTGEILAMITAPSYDPNELTGQGKQISKNYLRLFRDRENKPLFNRAIMSPYPPGSTFKVLQALIGMQENSLDTLSTRFSCIRSLVGCHGHASPLNLHGSIQHSCNPFYYQAFKKTLKDLGDGSVQVGLDKWRASALKFNLGKRTGLDLPSESRGRIPSSAYYTKRSTNRYNPSGKWDFGNIRSISIGQGEIGMTPIQMANFAATIANRGYFYEPHLVKAIGENGQPLEKYTIKRSTDINPEYFEYAAKAMIDVVRAGTARRAGLKDYVVCGKTGTAQNPHGEDHSVFMAFAPYDKPRIAIAVYVENGGYGGTWAAPIASLMMEKFLSGEIDEKKYGYKEKRIFEANLLEKKR